MIMPLFSVAIRNVLLLLYIVAMGINLQAQPDINIAPSTADTAKITEMIVPDVMPYFVGCDSSLKTLEERRTCSDKVCMQYVAEHLIYPEIALTADIEGTVYVGFDVTAEGKVTNISVLRDIGGGCGDEAIRVVSTMPDWLPARFGNRAVATRMSLPIRFQLTTDEPVLAAGYTINLGLLRGTNATKKQILDNINLPITVRDERGNQLEINELSFSYERDNKFETAQSNGTITTDMLKIVKRLRKGDTFVATAVVQRSGKFLFAERSFIIEE